MFYILSNDGNSFEDPIKFYWPQQFQWGQSLCGGIPLTITANVVNSKYVYVPHGYSKNTFLDAILMRVTAITIRLFFTFIHALCLKIGTRTMLITNG